jgi:hypothetical protein
MIGALNARAISNSLPAETRLIAALIFTSLLIRYSDHFGELPLGHAHHNAAFANPSANMGVDRGS